MFSRSEDETDTKTAGPSPDVSADMLQENNVALLCLGGLILVIHARVPEAGNVDGVVLDEIHQLVQTIDDNAAVSPIFARGSQCTFILPQPFAV